MGNCESPHRWCLHLRGFRGRVSYQRHERDVVIFTKVVPAKGSVTAGIPLHHATRIQRLARDLVCATHKRRRRNTADGEDCDSRLEGSARIFLLPASLFGLSSFPLFLSPLLKSPPPLFIPFLFPVHPSLFPLPFPFVLLPLRVSSSVSPPPPPLPVSLPLLLLFRFSPPDSLSVRCDGQCRLHHRKEFLKLIVVFCIGLVTRHLECEVFNGNMDTCVYGGQF